MAEAKKDEKKTLTQAEIDEIVEGRLKREREKHADYDELKAKADKFDELESKDKGEAEQLREKTTKLESDLAAANAKALRFEVAAEKGISKPQYISGTTREELEAAADQYLEDHPNAGTAGGGGDGGGAKPPPGKKPAPDLKGGTEPEHDEEVETDPVKLAEKVPRF